METVKWDTFKGLVGTKTQYSYFLDVDDNYLVFTKIGGIGIKAIIPKENPVSTEEQDFLDNYIAGATQLGDNKELVQNARPVTVHKTESPSLHKVTHDFCNAKTWWGNSIQVTGDAGVLIGATKTFQLTHTDIIDVENGVTTRQDLKQEYLPKIYVAGVLKVGGFTIDYDLGQVTFEVLPVGLVTADYYYADTSVFTLAPDENKRLLIEHSEVQFASDVEINTPLRFEIWVYNPADLPNKMLYQAVQYNSLRDFVNESNLGTGVIKKVGDLPTDILVFPFNYGSVKPLSYSQGAEMRVFSVDDIELTGSYATATFYCLSIDE